MLDFADDFLLTLNGISLTPLQPSHADGLAMACQDGKLWELTYTSTPTPDTVAQYIATAQRQHDRTAFAVMDKTGNVIGTTSYHDILPHCRRLEIGYTWYAKSHWQTHVNTTCKLLLLTHAFEVLNYHTVGLRTDVLNIRSQTAITRLGAVRDGIIRGNRLNKDGVISDTILYSITQNNWQTIKANLQQKLN